MGSEEVLWHNAYEEYYCCDCLIVSVGVSLMISEKSVYMEEEK